jgi:sugar lactone lactonase YvrE
VHILRDLGAIQLLDGAPRGRLLKYEEGQGMCVFMCGLHFPNGLQLSTKLDILYVAQTTRFRVLAVDVGAVM